MAMTSKNVNALEGEIEFLPGRLYYVALSNAPTRISSPGTIFFSIDDELIYWNFYLDFGPLNLGHTFQFADMLNKLLLQTSVTKERIYFYSSMQGQQRANAVCVLGCWAILFQNMTAAQAYEPFKRLRFPTFHDATPTTCTFQLTVLDVLCGLEKAIGVGYISKDTFDLQEYQHFERVENGDLTWVSPKFIAFAGPHHRYSRTPQGHVMLTPEHYIGYFKKKNVTLVVRLNDKQYDEKIFLSAGIDHLDLIYPDGTNASMAILMKFIDACEKTPGAVAVHCKAGLGRTGTCIGSYMMKHAHFTAHELIGWLRLCRPGSVIGPQQQFMESIESKMWDLKKSPVKSSIINHEKGLPNLNPIPMNVQSTRMDKDTKTQGDKLIDQKILRYSRNKATGTISKNSIF